MPYMLSISKAGVFFDSEFADAGNGHLYLEEFELVGTLEAVMEFGLALFDTELRCLLVDSRCGG